MSERYERASIHHRQANHALHRNQKILATMIAELDAKLEMSQNNIIMGFVRSNQPRMMRPVRNNIGSGLIRGARTLRNTTSMPARFTENGCYRCLQAPPGVMRRRGITSLLTKASQGNHGSHSIIKDQLNLATGWCYFLRTKVSSSKLGVF